MASCKVSRALGLQSAVRMDTAIQQVLPLPLLSAIIYKTVHAIMDD